MRASLEQDLIFHSLVNCCKPLGLCPPFVQTAIDVLRQINSHWSSVPEGVLLAMGGRLRPPASLNQGQLLVEAFRRGMETVKKST